MSEVDMGELRSALQEPNSESWSRVVAVLEKYDDAERLADEILPYVHEAISANLSKITGREAPETWRRALEAKLKEPMATSALLLLSLCDTLTPETLWSWGRSKGQTYLLDTLPSPPPMLAHKLALSKHVPATYIEWLATLEMPALTDVEIWSLPELTSAQCDKIAAASWWSSNVSSLMMVDGAQLAKRLGAAKKLTGVSSLSITNAEGSVSAEMLRDLLDAVGDGELTTLDCSSAWLGEDAIPVLSSHEAMKSVTDIDLRYNMGLYDIDDLLGAPNITREAAEMIQSYYDDIFE